MYYIAQTLSHCNSKIKWMYNVCIVFGLLIIDYICNQGWGAGKFFSGSGS